MSKTATEEGDGRLPKFKGCRSFSYKTDDGTFVLRTSYSQCLYRAGRLVEMAKSDGKSLNVDVYDVNGSWLYRLSTDDIRT